METIKAIWDWISGSLPQFITALVGLLSAVIIVCQLIPGNEPEATLQKIVDFLKKYSVK
jgi:hypothetical protein